MSATASGAAPSARGLSPASASVDGRGQLVHQLDVVYRGRQPPPIPHDPDEGGDAFSGESGVEINAVEIVDAGALSPVSAAHVALARPANVPLFSRLSQQTYAALLERMNAWNAEPGALIVAEGEQSDSVFVLVQGRARVERAAAEGPVQLAVLEPGAFFGEGALLARRPRAASVVALEACTLLELPRPALEELANDDPSVAMVLHQFSRERLLENLAHTSPLLQGLSPPVVRAALASFDLRRARATSVMVAEITDGAGLFLVVEGELDVHARGELGLVRVKRLGPGDVFGEMSLLGGRKTSASVTCATDCTLLCLPRPRFSALVEVLPELRERLQRLARERQAQNERFLPDATSTAVIG